MSRLVERDWPIEVVPGLPAVVGSVKIDPVVATDALAAAQRAEQTSADQLNCRGHDGEIAFRWRFAANIRQKLEALAAVVCPDADDFAFFAIGFVGAEEEERRMLTLNQVIAASGDARLLPNIGRR